MDSRKLIAEPPEPMPALHADQDATDYFAAVGAFGVDDYAEARFGDDDPVVEWTADDDLRIELERTWQE